MLLYIHEKKYCRIIHNFFYRSNKIFSIFTYNIKEYGALLPASKLPYCKVVLSTYILQLLLFVLDY